MKRYGKIVGLYIPIKESEDEEVRRAIDRLGQTVEAVIAQSGWDEETLSRALDLSSKKLDTSNGIQRLHD